MKRFVLFALTVLAITVMSCKKDDGGLSGDDIIEFRDPNFLKALLTVRDVEAYDPDTDDWSPYLMNVDSNMDGKISVNEAKIVKVIDMPGNIEVREMPEIKYFTSLTALSTGGTGSLYSLDVSRNTALKYLWCERERLTSLTTGKNNALKCLFCDSNKLTDLDLSGCPRLESLTCSFNRLTILDASKCPKLKALKCQYNPHLTTIDISGCTEIELLHCSSNTQLTKIRINIKNKLPQYLLEEHADIIEWVK